MIRTAAGLIDLMRPSLSVTMMPSAIDVDDRFEVLLRAVQCRQVAADEDVSVGHHRGGDANVQRRAVRGAVAAVHDAPGRDDCDGVHCGADKLTDREADRLVGGSTVDGLGGGIPAGDQSGRSGRDDRVADVVDQARLVAEHGLGGVSLADVSGDDLIGELVLPHRHHRRLRSPAELPSIRIICAGYRGVQSPTSRSSAIPAACGY